MPGLGHKAGARESRETCRGTGVGQDPSVYNLLPGCKLGAGWLCWGTRARPPAVKELPRRQPRTPLA